MGNGKLKLAVMFWRLELTEGPDDTGSGIRLDAHSHAIPFYLYSAIFRAFVPVLAISIGTSSDESE